MLKHPTSLDKTIRSQKLRADPKMLSRIRRWLRNTVNVLQNLHDAGFVHMDIKSDNVLITS